ncbi:MAG: aminotransferase class V-fold PLP-dependent enzyme [Halobacteriovoraceae bacterium]|nr:aminotransferase class V-fold PLP-dependent enzyme [Halobacteriovoraceae bacterium]
MIYCDYNASAPLSDKLKGVFFDLPFANASSQHLLAKEALKAIHQTEDYLLKTFNVSSSHRCLFHSGATEGANTFILGLARKLIDHHPLLFLYSRADHPCVTELEKVLDKRGVELKSYKTTEEFVFPRDEVEKLILKAPGMVILNFTWVHHELGVKWSLEDLKYLKSHYSEKLFIHVDATQSVGKIEKFCELQPLVDCYTYSGHKFGALKGVGWSFIHEELCNIQSLEPLMVGGGQQGGLRSGTLNTHGIVSLKVALEEIMEKKPESQNHIEDFREKMKKLLASKGSILPNGKNDLNNNTVFFYLHETQSDVFQAALDREDIAVGTGSACSSGSLRPNQTLMAMGLEEYAKNSIRISFSPAASKKDFEEVLARMSKVLARF